MRFLIVCLCLLVILAIFPAVDSTAQTTAELYYYANGQRIPLRRPSRLPAANLLTRQTFNTTGSAHVRWDSGVYQVGTVELVTTDEIIVSYLPNTPLPQINQISTTHSLTPIRQLGAANIWTLRVPPNGDAIQIANALQESGQVDFAEPNFLQIFQPFSPPDDPLFPQQWYLQNSGQIAGSLPGADIEALNAWTTQTGSGVIVAVLDEGVDLTHPDLASNIVSPFDPYEAEAGIQPKPWDSHGTSVAGIVAASTNNTTGVAGVCPDCQIMPIRIFYRPTTSSTSLYGTTANVAAGIDYAWQNGAAVLNNSWGGSPSSAISAALDRAMTQGRGGLGAVVIAAAGNNYNSSIAYPANYPGVISVAATNLCDALKNPVSNACNAYETWGSTHGNGIDIAAPGIAITTTDNAGANGSNPGDYRTDFRMTSSATPIVAGVTALIVADQPTFTAEQIAQQLYASAEDVNSTTKPGYDTDIGWGRVNAARALIQWRVTTINGPENAWERDPLFQWQHVTTVNDVSAYRLTVYDLSEAIIYSGVFNADMICQAGNCAVRPGIALSAGDYSWELRSVSDSLGASMPSDRQNLTLVTSVLGDPQGIRTDIGGDPTFTWSTVNGPEWYQLLVSDGNKIVLSLWKQSTAICTPHPGTCSINPVSLDAKYVLYNGNYQWTIRGWQQVAGYGVFAAVQTFTLDAPPPELVQFDTPAVTGEDTLRPSFHFIAPDGATQFRLALLDSGSSVWDVTLSRADACGSYGATSCTVQAPFDLTDDHTYDFYIRATGPGGVTDTPGTPGNYAGWQGALSFTLDVPSPVQPANLSTSLDNVDVILEWDDDPLASWFELIIVDANTSQTIHKKWYQKNQSLIACANDRCSVMPRAVFYNRVYRWWVRGWGSKNFSGYTRGPDVDLSALAPPDMPDTGGFMTFNGETYTDLDQLNYQWNDVDRASWFRLAIADMQGNLKLDKWYRRMDVCQSGVCIVGPDGGVDPNLRLINGTYQWGVLAWGPGGKSSRPESATFVIGGDVPSAPDMSMTSPTGVILTGNPAFTWMAVSGATSYEIYVGYAGGGKILKKTLVAVDVGCSNNPGGECVAGNEDVGVLNLKNGDYVWYLRASGPGGTGAWSVARAFSVEIPPPGGPAVLVSPMADAVLSDSSVVFEWQATSDTTWYRHRLYDADMNLVVEKWLKAETVGCVSGGVCRWVMSVGLGHRFWTVSVYGPGTVGASYQESTAAGFYVLEEE